MHSRSIKSTTAFFLALLVTANGIRGQGHVTKDDISNKGRFCDTRLVVGENLLIEIRFLSLPLFSLLYAIEANSTID